MIERKFRRNIFLHLRHGHFSFIYFRQKQSVGCIRFYIATPKALTGPWFCTKKVTDQVNANTGFNYIFAFVHLPDFTGIKGFGHRAWRDGHAAGSNATYSIKLDLTLRAQWPFATYLYIAGYWAYLQKIYKVKIYKTTHWYACHDHKNTVLRSEHFRWIRERKFGKNNKNYEKL